MTNEVTVKESGALIEFSNEQLQLIKNQFFPQGATDLEFEYCMGVAKNLGLDPILKQIYFVPRKTEVNGRWAEKIEPLAGRDAFLSLAHRSGKFGGIEVKTEIKDMPKLINGTWQKQSDLIAIATVYRTDSERPFIVEVAYREYVQTKKNGEATKFWAEKPETMLKKVAESQCLKKAFNISGLYIEEEEVAENNKPVNAKKQTGQGKKVDIFTKGEETIDEIIEAEIEDTVTVNDIKNFYLQADKSKKTCIAEKMQTVGEWKSFDSKELFLLLEELKRC